MIFQNPNNGCRIKVKFRLRKVVAGFVSNSESQPTSDRVLATKSGLVVQPWPPSPHHNFREIGVPTPGGQLVRYVRVFD